MSPPAACPQPHHPGPSAPDPKPLRDASPGKSRVYPTGASSLDGLHATSLSGRAGSISEPVDVPTAVPHWRRTLRDLACGAGGAWNAPPAGRVSPGLRSVTVAGFCSEGRPGPRSPGSNTEWPWSVPRTHTQASLPQAGGPPPNQASLLGLAVQESLLSESHSEAFFLEIFNVLCFNFKHIGSEVG